MRQQVSQVKRRLGHGGRVEIDHPELVAVPQKPTVVQIPVSRSAQSGVTRHQIPLHPISQLPQRTGGGPGRHFGIGQPVDPLRNDARLVAGCVLGQARCEIRGPGSEVRASHEPTADHARESSAVSARVPRR